MSRLVHHLRLQRDHRRSRREIDRALAASLSTAMREDLLIEAQRHTTPFSR